MKQENIGAVTLVGAGCGSWDLLTLRGLRVLREADAVVYDDLIDGEVLAFVREDAERIYVGKRNGRHGMKQSEINALLLRLALDGKNVCRLKGGDPYVFGRGGEEVLALTEMGIECREVPGISSSIAIPAASGIPVTHRGLSRSFHVVTAHTADTADGLPEDLPLLAQLHGTLVFLMGLSRLRALAEGLMRYGMNADTPAAVLGRETYRGTLVDIADVAKDARPPAVILVGAVAALHLCEARKPACPRVALTGTPHFQKRMREALERNGIATQSVQTSTVEAVSGPEALCAALDAHPSVIALTSPNGVESFFKCLCEARRDARDLCGIRFAVVGPGTAAALQAHGICADLMPEVHDTEALGELLAREAVGGRVLLAGAEERSSAPSERLRAAGVAYRELTLYRLKASVCTDLGGCDAIVFGSASAVLNYFAAGGKMPKVAVCIGRQTQAQALRYGCTRTITAADATPEALTAAVQKAIEA